ncbi:uncharacterized protein LOC105202380 isoform X1 [Solenopsis invicta]|uniref:uncharacterized protein LOC105202380 isoform X1 n=1 Tax=Solenopsis invicta TaxID=13686 RepID=UPI0005960730|nr:uncharacterized protein LOC105202380 isoform X1 [Solenopsis invicta]XP_039314191.1 uncharacterized protein LOC105202380 isoform X1 [Solenopsis invicta]
MGNNSSSSHQYCASNGPSQEIAGRGWTQSFPRELGRHHPQQPTGHKVLPEPPNQRLRATNNGSIIHNGGTISGRRPPALTLPHDLNKQGIFRSRSTSASNIGASRGRKIEHNCCYYGNGTRCCMENEMQELKRFGSEPDLRYSPMAREAARCNGKQQQHQHAMEHRHCGSGHYPERECRERESRYRGKKKYKAPAPPSNGVVDGSSPDSYRNLGSRYNESGQNRPGGCRGDEEIQPPPRRSRLFKTRAETKRAQVNWVSSSSQTQAIAERCENGASGLENERRWRGEDGRVANKENRLVWRDQSNHPHQDRWCRDEHRRSRIFDGKNTLQRSMSSPEFQAELMQVARKVRNKLNCGGRSSVESAILERNSDTGVSRSAKESKLEEAKRPEKRSAKSEESCPEEHVIENRIEERRLTDRCNRSENKRNSYDERKGNARDPGRTKDYLEERQAEAVSGGKRRLVEKPAMYNESSAMHPKEPLRKSPKDRLDVVGHSSEEKFSSEKHRRELLEDYQRAKSVAKSRKYENAVDSGRTRSESPVRPYIRVTDPRGQGSGRESTPERTSEAKESEKERDSDRRWRKSDVRNTDGAPDEKRWSCEPVPATAEKKDAKSKEKLARKPETKEVVREKNWHVLPLPEKSAPKTFYFGMDEALSNESRNCVDQHMEQIQSRLQAREINGSIECHDYTDDGKSGIEDISLKLRPTLPKKQLEIPRFSPSAAWRLLSALEAPGPTMSTASEEVPVMFEERIERLSRPPPPLIALGPRSSHDKSGDSGISGDAGAANDDSLDVSTNTNNNRLKTPATRPTWTPQQDLGEESSSDAGVDSPPPMPTPVKFPPRAHVFSLSLPRDDNRMYLYNPDLKNKEGSTFNSLQKLKRSVSGALGLGPLDLERKRTRDVLDDNWLLSTSAPTSLQHTQITDATRSSPPGWKPGFDDEDDDEILADDLEDRGDFPVIMKPPSFSYLASGGHVMYLPESNDSQYQPQSLNYRNNIVTENFEKNSGNSSGPKYRKNGVDEFRKPSKDIERTNKHPKESVILKEKSFANDGKVNTRFSKSCDNISEMKQRSTSPPVGGQQNLQDDKEIAPEVKTPLKNNSKGRRFTFQSTVRQIERRRLAEKLSREAEAKERQRKGELEAMRKVEEEFQRKRAREKANIRQQLRLYSMDENMSSLPTVWDNSQLSRADPDGAPSSSASSPTSVPPAKLTTIRKSSVSSDEYLRKRASSADSRQQQQQQHQQQPREYKDYRPKYYDWAPTDSSSHLEYKQTTVHPKVVCDIPKSSPIFVDAHTNSNKTANLSSTPRSDNYRKDFAHGAVAARSSLASSDSELSQPNTRPHSRQAVGKSKPLRSRSASPTRSEEAVSTEDETPVEPIKQERSRINGFVLNGVQPFVREKSYRPISFNPQPPPPIPS